MPKYKMDKQLQSFLKYKRKEAGFTTDGLAEQIQYSPSSYNNYELGKNKNIQLDLIIDILHACYNKINRSIDIEDKYKSFDYYVGKSISDFIHYGNTSKFGNLGLQDPFWARDALWLQALSLTCLDVDLFTMPEHAKVVWNKLKSMYNMDNRTNIFETLNENRWLIKKYLYPEKNQVYIKPLTDAERYAGYVNVPRINFNLSKDDIEDMVNKSKHGSINSAILFMLIFNGEMEIDHDEQKALRRTCDFFHDNSISIVYNVLNVYSYEPYNLTDVYIPEQFRTLILNALEDTIQKTDNAVLKTFKNNFENAGARFLNVIAVDFSFIKGMGSPKDALLKNAIEKTVNDFKNSP